MKIPKNSIPHNTPNLQNMLATDVEAVFYLDDHDHRIDLMPLLSLAPASTTWLKLLASLRQVKQAII